ncbi:helix-turn-helix domain-containing protein [Mesobacillus campisalis]|uniref:helix-turn-helix domain-containing protein n=1 Tax=Mesobacillus campisalis TaxID=1408103 RepID=UPI00069CA378|nr:helix-turn-helix transcriptional regulator [Mesobacillus campisalis]
MDGKKLKELRMKKSLTLSRLSELTGISKSYLSLIERDIQNNPSLDILQRLSRHLDIEVEDLVKNDIDQREVVLNATPTVKSTFKVEIEFSEEQMSPQKLQQIKDLINNLKQG